MTQADFESWMRASGFATRQGFRYTAAGRALGLTRHTMRKYHYQPDTIPVHVQLAMTAIRMNLWPYRETMEDLTRVAS